MNALRLASTQAVEAAAGRERRRTRWLVVVLRAAGRALRVEGRAFASPGALWWFGIPWQSHWPSGKGRDGGER